MLKDLPAGTQLSIQAHPFKFLNVVTADYINQQIEAFGLSHTELVRLLDMRPENLTRIMEDRKGLTKLGKAVYYPFLYYPFLSFIALHSLCVRIAPRQDKNSRLLNTKKRLFLNLHLLHYLHG